MEDYLSRSLTLSRLSMRDPDYFKTWNKLEDDILSLPSQSQSELYEACLAWPHNGAMIIFSILPEKDA